jgi:hypothetical protein
VTIHRSSSTHHHEEDRMIDMATRRALVAAPLVFALVSACGDVAPPSAPAARVAPSAPQLGVQPLKGTWTVTSLDDPGSGGCTTSYCTLRQAVAGARNGDRIVFKSTVRGTIALTGKIQIESGVQIDGGNRITLDGQGADIVLTTYGDTIELIGLTLTGGSFGAINTVSGSLTLRNVTVTGNTSTFGGAGIRHGGGSLTLINSSVVNNSTPGEGAGIWAIGGPVTIVNSTFSGNNAGSYGGAIFVSGTGPVTTITSSTISGNSALIGGGIFDDGGSVTVRSSAIVQNNSPGQGGGLAVETPTGQPAVISFVSSIVAGNGASDCYLDNPVDGTIQSLGRSIVSSGITGCFWLYPASQANTDNMVDPSLLYTDVLESQLSNNGGPTLTHALIERGRAVDAGSCPGLSTDQRGVARPYDDVRIPNAWDACDIGPCEWTPPATMGRRK